MHDRLARLEKAMEELRAENRELRADVQEIRERIYRESGINVGVTTPSRRRILMRWAVPLVSIVLVVVPVVVLTLNHATAFWSTVIGALNALFVYFVGPGAIRLLAEGLVRAVPGIVLGQTTRLAVDSMRRKKAK